MPTTVSFNKAEAMSLKMTVRKNAPQVLVPVTAELTARLARDMEWWVLLDEAGEPPNMDTVAVSANKSAIGPRGIPAITYSMSINGMMQ